MQPQATREAMIAHAGQRRACFEQEAMVHVRALLRTAVRLCRRHETAEDLVQETMLRAWKSFDQYQPQTNCKAWLFTILMNLWTEEQRRPWSRHEAASHEQPDPDQQWNAATSDERVFVREVLTCIDRLPQEQRCVLLLAVVEGLALREIAEMLKVPMGTVMSRLGRARAAVRQHVFADAASLQALRERKLCDAMKPKGC